MTAKQFYDWQTSGGTDDVTRLVAVLERADVAWCVIGGLAVNHWAEQPMVTQDVDLVVASDAVERTVTLNSGTTCRASCRTRFRSLTEGAEPRRALWRGRRSSAHRLVIFVCGTCRSTFWSGSRGTCRGV
ncbi:MAG: hypothetical protein FJ225_13530 [Lentisphaerae bacterium]|nr:hypothetical protein [Lentisphaerota bacterium]